MPTLETIDANLRTALRFFGEATGMGEVSELPGATAISSGLDYGVFNIALMNGRVVGERDFDRRLDECCRYYRPRTQRWSFWVCEDLLDYAAKRRARQAFPAAGFRVISRAPGMFAEKFLAPKFKLPEIECHHVATSGLRDCFGEVTSTCFDIPLTISRAVYSPERGWRGAYQGYVGYSNGRPVGVVALVRDAGAVGIYSLGVLPEFRGQGYAEAIMRAALNLHQDVYGSEPMVLQSTEAGHPLYLRLGFRDTASFTVYLTK